MENQLHLFKHKKEIKEIVRFLESKNFEVSQFRLLEGGDPSCIQIFRIEIKKKESK